MTPVVIRITEQEVDAPCALCGRRFVGARGLHLASASDLRPVCRDCGRVQAGGLLALLELAGVAEHVGRIHFHNALRIPMTMLLELARAAEKLFAMGGQHAKP